VYNKNKKASHKEESRTRLGTFLRPPPNMTIFVRIRGGRFTARTILLSLYHKIIILSSTFRLESD